MNETEFNSMWLWICCLSSGLGCYPEKVFEEEIIQTVTEAVRRQAQVAVDLKKVREQEQYQIEQKRCAFECQLQQFASEQKALSTENVRMYENLVDGSLSQDEYIRQKSGLAGKLEKIRNEEIEIRRQISELVNTDYVGFEAYQGLLDMDSLTREQVCSLLERVTIFPEGRLEIKLRYADELDHKR